MSGACLVNTAEACAADAGWTIGDETVARCDCLVAVAVYCKRLTHLCSDLGKRIDLKRSG